LEKEKSSSCGFALSLFLSVHIACFMPREALNKARRELVKKLIVQRSELIVLRKKIK